MRGAIWAFNGLTPSLVVVNGAVSPFPLRDGGNLWSRVYSTMLVQICLDYPGLPDVRSLKASEIKFFYMARLPELVRLANG